MNYKYKIGKEAENKLDTVILKENATIKFTLRDILTARSRGEKIIKEYEGQMAVFKAEVDNILANYPDLFEDGKLKASEEEIKNAVAIALFDGKSKEIKKYEDAIEAYKKAIVDDEKEIEVIKEQTGIVLDEEVKDSQEDEQAGN